MFLNKYLNSTYIDLIYSTYDENYINNLDEDNFDKIYKLFKKNNFYFIDDIVLNYLELFEIEEKYVSNAISVLKKEMGNDYVSIIGKNTKLLEKLLDFSIELSEKDN